ncbi:MAG: hypothetical protein G01um101425_716 [Candidatus Peregrinibacteria bacterium Gr01-1014_25]|nr:MAG: hypothetical protein G01um101425_716 [Candidatus Peregrinibacteria bacterium Gr01-1014_25]
MSDLSTLLRTYLFIIPLAVLLMSEVAKGFVEATRSGTWHTHLFRPGGMPSSHSAFVTSLLIVVGRVSGIDSTAFALAVAIACLTWYDAMGSRRALGEQAKVLNRLQHWQHLTERLGHSGKEVLAGIIFGAAVTEIGILLS